MKQPCKDCPDRIVGCHSTCEKYKEYCSEWEEIKKKRAEERKLAEFLDGRKINKRARRKHKR